MSIASIDEVLEDLRQGKQIILVDDPDRENEGDLAMLAEHVTPADISFMANEGRGLICLAMDGEHCDRLDLIPQTGRNTNPLGTAFTVSINSREVTGSGMSSADRALTIRRAVDPDTTSADFRRPGHMFPLRARDGGVLVREGQTEGIVDLARLAGGRGAGVICEIMNDDGTMARMPELEVFAARHNLKIATIESLIAYRRATERLVEPVELGVPMPTEFGELRTHLFRSLVDGKEHVALTVGIDGPDDYGHFSEIPDNVYVRVHSECLTGDVFHSLRCDCGPQLDKALAILAQKQHGVLVYMRQEGRGIGLANKLRAYKLQDGGMDTVEANQALGFAPDLREYGIGAQILHFLGVRNMTLLTNNPKKMHGLAGYGLTLLGQERLEIPPNAANVNYLRTKRDKMGHTFGNIELAGSED